MIDRTHDLPLTQQARLVGLSRSSLYYQEHPVSERDGMLMNLIDRLHTEWPFAGARMLRDMLRRDGHDVGRRHVGTLMRLMGIEALYCKKKTSPRNPEHPVYPYLLRGLTLIEEPESRVGHRYHLHSDAARVLVLVRCSRLGNANCSFLATLQHAYDGLP